MFLQPNYSVIANDCNLGRNYEDVTDSWDSVVEIIQKYAKNEGNFAELARPGYFNDPDQV